MYNRRVHQNVISKYPDCGRFRGPGPKRSRGRNPLPRPSVVIYHTDRLPRRQDAHERPITGAVRAFAEQLSRYCRAAAYSEALWRALHNKLAILAEVVASFQGAVEVVVLTPHAFEALPEEARLPKGVVRVAREGCLGLEVSAPKIPSADEIAQYGND